MSLLRSSRKPSTRRSANTDRRPTFSYTGPPKRKATGQPDDAQAASKQRTCANDPSCLEIPTDLAYMSDMLMNLVDDDEDTIELPISEEKVPSEIHGHILNIMRNARDTGYFPDQSTGETKSNARQHIPQPLPSNGLACLQNPQLVNALPANMDQLAKLMVAFDYLGVDQLVHLVGAAIAVQVMNGGGASKSQ